MAILGALQLKERKPGPFAFLNSQKKDLDDLLENNLMDSFQERDQTKITDFGVILSKIPFDPKLAKIILVASKYDLLHYAIMIVACMSVQEIYDDESIMKSIQINPDFAKDLADDFEGMDEDLITSIDRNKKKAEMKIKIKAVKD